MTRTTTGMDPPLQMSTPHQLEEVRPTKCDLKCNRPTYTVYLKVKLAPEAETLLLGHRGSHDNVSILRKLMDCLQSQSSHIFKYDEQRSLSSSEKDYEVLSLSEMNELENWATGFGETVDYLDLYTNDDVGDVSLNFQQYEYRESERSF
ncbi:hypothetical protein AVEN_246936-1 [Araneus ventricosus]|uniref:Uncharacterized protein n=1 Tax=Araneus ventricosus TaxID=182803 RepID=A0A4Y2S033_ARAVE|nr:hypothetical protein AVEN_246936-1 [Araneus ventricosus]